MLPLAFRLICIVLSAISGLNVKVICLDRSGCRHQRLGVKSSVEHRVGKVASIFLHRDSRTRELSACFTRTVIFVRVTLEFTDCSFICSSCLFSFYCFFLHVSMIFFFLFWDFFLTIFFLILLSRSFPRIVHRVHGQQPLT